ncbi:Zinc finger, GRF-type [Sesbania bispinosa]|nr:Zinc finger, GRF-type [Sesbania bispinosa]
MSTNSSCSFHESNHSCRCGIPCKVQISLTEQNPGRRFFGCGAYGGSSNHCEYFRWFDPPTYERSARVINGLIKKRDNMENEMHCMKAELSKMKSIMNSQVKELERYKATNKILKCIIASCLVIALGLLFSPNP